MGQKGVKAFGLLGAGFILVFLSACASSNHSTKQAQTIRKTNRNSESGTSFATRWQPAQNDSIPVVMNDSVKKVVQKFSTQWKSSFDKWINRIGMYGPTIEKVLREEGVPPDLIYLSMIESGFNLSAKSHASAVGPWQFIQSTGKMYGLKNDLFMDDRSNLIVSTRAAARHLKDLYNEFGDWYLAFAAYNAGSGGVNRAIRRAGSRDFWKLAHTRYLHPETKEYVPKILAAMHIVKHYKQYGYVETDFSMPLQYDVVSIDDAADIGAIAASAGTNVDAIQKLNPALISGVTRPQSTTLVYLPNGAKGEFTRNFANLPAHKRVTYLAHPAQAGDSLKSLAAYYGVESAQIAKLNGLKGTAEIKPGQEIKIPATKDVLLALTTKPFNTSKSSNGKTVYHKVKKGDTLARVAKKYGTSTQALAKWNKLGKKSALRAGQTLKIVKKGATSAPSNPRPFYAAGFANSKWSAPVVDAQTFASNTETNNESDVGSIEDTKRGLTGVAHLIFLEEQNVSDDDDLTDESKPQQIAVAGWKSEEDDSFEQNVEEEVDITQVAASEDGDVAPEDAAEFPGFVKTYENETPETQVQVQPAEENKTNKTNAAQYHVVKSGETLTSIAKKYNVTIAALRQNNHLQSDALRAEQKLKITNTSSTAIKNKPSPQTATPQYHVVKSGESLGQIATKYRMTVGTLKKINNLSENTIRVNQKLLLNQQKNVSNGKSPNSSYVVHKIRAGDTLWTLAKKYHVSITDIKAWNHLISDALRANQSLKIFAKSM